jgi:hypothetical protein
VGRQRRRSPPRHPQRPPTLFVAVRFVVVLVPAVFLVPRPRVPWRDVVLVGLFMSVGQFALAVGPGVAVGRSTATPARRPACR